MESAAGVIPRFEGEDAGAVLRHLKDWLVMGMKMKMVSESAGSLVICVSVVVLLVAKGFVRLPRPRILSRGRLV